jgi:hypothetical protein
MLGLIEKLAPLLTGLTNHEDGSLKPVAGDFHWLVRLPLLIGAVMVLLSFYGPGVTAAQKDQLLQSGLALLVAGPAIYHGRKQATKLQAAPKPAPLPVPPVPPAPEAPKSDVDAANAIEKL